MNKELEMYINKEVLTESDLDDLKNILEEASYHYYNTGKIIMSDETFDKLMDKYTEYRERIVGSEPLENSRTINVDHQYKELVGTLSKCNSINEFKEAFIDKHFIDGDKIKLLVTIKYDGNSVVMSYKNGKLESALTRGKNGKGKDLTFIFKDHEKLSSINEKNSCAIKYEIVTTDEKFEQMLKDYEDSRYANKRSFVAGMLGRNDSEKYANYLIGVPLWIKYKDKEITRDEELDSLEKIFPNNYNNMYSYICEGTIDEVVKDIKELYDSYTETRDELPFAIDGLVIEILDENIRKELGYTNDKKDIPKWAIALKFPYLEKESVVEKIEFSISENGTGIITPMCYFKPVDFNGTTHRKQSLQNYKQFKEKKLGIGSPILVQYRNDVLTYIEPLESKDKITPVEFIKNCPVCNSDLVINDNETYVFCDNINCPSRIRGKIVNYLTKLDIKGIKMNKIVKLETIIKTISDLYTVSLNSIQDILGEKEGLNVYNAIHNNKDKMDYEVLASLGIDEVALGTAKDVCKEIPLKEMVNMNKVDLYEKLQNINGISDKLASYIVTGLKENKNLLDDLFKFINIKNIKDHLKVDSVTYTFVITGSLEKFNNRKELKEILENRGHKVSNTVSKKTDYLINNDIESTSGKNKTARELGINIITENVLIELLQLDK